MVLKFHLQHDKAVGLQTDEIRPGRESNMAAVSKIAKVNRKAMIRNYYNLIPYPNLNTKRKRRTPTKFDTLSRKIRTVNQVNSSFPKQSWRSLTFTENLRDKWLQWSGTDFSSAGVSL